MAATAGTADGRALATPLTDLLGIDHPILLAPMGDAAGGRLAAAVSAAGALGLVGGGYADPDWLTRELELAGDARVGVGFITFALDERPKALDLALDHGVPVIQLSFGDPTPYIGRIHDAGALVICQVQRTGDARRCADAGADIVIAQGQDSGGHGRPGRGTLGLVPAMVDAIDPVPVVAAGGIADGRGVVAALALGAQGVTLGTRLFASEEALIDGAEADLLVERTGDDTVRTAAFDVIRGPAWPEGHDGRALVNRTVRRWEDGPHDDEEVAAMRAEYRAAVPDPSVRPVWAGEGLDLVRSIAPAGEIIRDIVGDATEVLARLC